MKVTGELAVHTTVVCPGCLFIINLFYLPVDLRILKLLLLLLISVNLIHAQNLVANGGFEDENICAEYKQNCAPEAWINSSLKSYNYFDIGGSAFEGRHFIGVITGNSRINSVRSFMRTRLLCGLRKDHRYVLQFYIRSRHAVTDSLGVYFSATDFLFEKRHYSQLAPAVYVRDSSKQIARNDTSWKKISLLYTATGEENFLTIGCFKRQEYKYYAPPEIQGNYYLYIDDMQFLPVDTRETLCTKSDSNKAVIYADNVRHGLLESRIRYYTKNVPEEPALPSTLLQQIDTLIIPDVLFATASAKLNDNMVSILDSFCLQLALRNIDSLLVEGHTDSIGALEYNNTLSADRAGAVSAYIISHANIESNIFRVRHFAYLRPVSSNQTPQGRQRNRRVEIYLYTWE